jgi:hypothetical protein
MTRIARHSRTLVRTIAALAAALVVTLGLATAPASAGPIEWQATGGWYTDSDDFFLGAGARFGLATITIIPNAEYVFVNSGTLLTLNIDGTLNVLPLGVATGYVGAGMGMVMENPDVGSNNTDSAFNLIAGAGLNAIKFKPFGQFKLIMKTGDDPLVLAFGIRF